MKRFRQTVLGVSLLAALGTLSGCIVVPRREVRPLAPCPRAVWVPAHQGEYGRWHPGHWRCD